MARLAVKLTVISLIPIVGFAYTNCSKVGFQNYELESKAAGLGAQDASSGTILINEGADFTNSKDVVLRMDHNSADQMFITNNPSCDAGGSWEPYNRKKTWKLDADNQEAKVYARFRTGDKIDEACYSDVIVHDDIAPVVDFKRAAGSFFNKSNFDFEFVVSDNLSGVGPVQCDKDAAWSTACSVGVKNHALGEGFHYIKIIATDKAGNKSASKEDSFTIDLTPPSVKINSSPAKISGDKAGRFAFSATDALSGIAGYECRPNAIANFAACTSPYNGTFSEGANSFQVRATDAAGNVSQPETYTWNIDLTAPSVQITKGPNSPTNLNVAQFEFNGQDEGVAITNFRCSVDGSAPVVCSSPFTTAALAEGNHKFEVIGYDGVGNPSAPAPYNWSIDRTKPTVSLVSYPAARTREVSASFGFSATDGANGSGIKETLCSLDGASYSVCVSPQAYSALADGAHGFYVMARDNAGNASDAVPYNWFIDNVKPILQITSAPSGSIEATVADIVFNATDASGGSIASYECRIDAKNWEACSSPKHYEDLIIGSHVFEVRATDSVGNISDIKHADWIITLPPVVICDPLGSTTVTQPGVAARLTYYDGSNASSQIRTVNDLFTKGKKVENTVILFNNIYVPTRSFTAGFNDGSGSKLKNSGGQDLIEWFGLDYTSNLKVGDGEAGLYQIATLSDDGSQVWIDQNNGGGMQLMVSNDDHHSTRFVCGGFINIKKGDRFPIRMKYFQGPRDQIAVTLMWRKVTSMVGLDNTNCGSSDDFFELSSGAPKSKYNTILSKGWKPIPNANFEMEENIPNDCSNQ